MTTVQLSVTCRCGHVESGYHACLNPPGGAAGTARRSAARYVLIEHQRRGGGGGCHCGWGDKPEHLGLSWAEHVCDELAAVGVVEVKRP